MPEFHKNLIIIENQSTFNLNALFDDAIIQGRVIEKEYKFVFQLIFSNDSDRLIAFRRVALTGTNPYRERFFCSDKFQIDEKCDFFDAFKSQIEEIKDDEFDLVIGGNESNLSKVKELIKRIDIVDPYKLIDKEYFYSK